jgi:hypothetical protein
MKPRTGKAEAAREWRWNTGHRPVFLTVPALD